MRSLVLARQLCLALLAAAGFQRSVLALQSTNPPPGVLNESAEFVAPDGEPDRYFGWSVALDGDTAVVCMTPQVFPAVNQPGSAYVFVRGAGGWSLQAKLTPPDQVYPYGFAWSTAIEGDRLVVGAIYEGAVYVFERSGSTWSAGQRITEPGASSFGAAVALEGDRIVAGDPTDSASRGAVYVLDLVGSQWTVSQKLVGADVTGVSRLGSSVALRGARIVAGAPTSDSGGLPAAGSAYVFEFDGGAWTQREKLLAGDPTANTYFGERVQLDGETIAVGAPASNFPPLGAVYVFSHSSGAWQQEAKIVSVDNDSDDRFGSALALRGDRFAVGAHIAGGGTGKAYVFRRGDAGWQEESELVPANPYPGARFGFALAFSGHEILVGAPYAFPAGTSSGAAYLFDIGPTGISHYCIAAPNSTGEGCTLDASGSLDIVDDDFTLHAFHAPPFKNGRFFYGANPAQIPMAAGYLCISPFHPGLLRLPSPGTTDAAGSAHLQVDFAQLPPAGAITPGSTWYFQFWYRDGSTGLFNLSDGLGVTFAP